MSRNDTAVYVGNLSENVTEDLLYELFLQAGPVGNVTIPRSKPFGFVHFKHRSSVLYAMNLLNGISLFGKPLRVSLPKGAPRPLLLPPLGAPRMAVDSSPVQPQAVSPAMNRSTGDKDLRDHLNSRTNPRFHGNHMTPGKRRQREEKPPPPPSSLADLNAIPDFLGSSFDPLYGGSGPGRRGEKPSRSYDNFDNRGRNFHDDDDDYHHHHTGDRHSRNQIHDGGYGFNDRSHRPRHQETRRDHSSRSSHRRKH